MRFTVEINLDESGHRDDGWWRAEVAHMLAHVANHVGARRPVDREPILDRNRRAVGYFAID